MGSQILGSTFEQNWYFHFDKAIDPFWIDKIREFCDQSEEEEALTGENTDPTKAQHSLRKNKVSWHNNEILYNIIRPFGLQANVVAGWNYNLTRIEPMQYTVYYGDRNHYNWHIDSMYKEGMETIRKITAIIQLSDESEYEGGDFELAQTFDCNDEHIEFDTEIINMNNIIKQKGSILLFPSFLFHRVKPITSGVRRTLVCWFHGPKWI